MRTVESSMILALVVLFLTTGCMFFEKPDDNSIEIKGVFSGSPLQTLVKKGSAGIQNRGISPSEVFQVIVFPGEYHKFYVKDVKNGSFSVEVDRGYPYAIIFSDSQKRFLGFITYGHGINTMPLHTVKEGVSTIDLGALLSSGKEIQPEKNPIGNQIVLTQDEIKTYAQSNSFFTSVLLNPDADGDGIIDVLTPSYYRLSVTYFIKGGVIGQDQSVQLYDAAQLIGGYRIVLWAYEDSGVFPDTLQWWDSKGNDITDPYSSTSNKIIHNQRFVSYGSKHIEDVYPTEGEYKIRYGSKTLRFTLPDQSHAPENILLAIPSVVLNPNGTVKSIGWKYRSPGSETYVNPKLFTKYLLIQIVGTGPQYPVDPQHPYQIYQSGEVDVALGEHILKFQGIYWSNVDHILMNYHDYFGNSYVVKFVKETEY